MTRTAAAGILSPVASSASSLGSVVEAICRANGDLFRGRHGEVRRRPLPSREVVAGVITGLRSALFPWHFGPTDITDEGMKTLVESCPDLAGLHLSGSPIGDDGRPATRPPAAAAAMAATSTSSTRTNGATWGWIVAERTPIARRPATASPSSTGSQPNKAA